MNFCCKDRLIYKYRMKEMFQVVEKIVQCNNSVRH